MIALGLLLLLAQADSVRIALVGDSTVQDSSGWGPGFRAALAPGVQIVNHAKGGRSSKSFRDEGLWPPVLAARPHYVLIQFGHNDVPGKGAARETVAGTSFRANLTRYVHEARSAGITPILITSIVRRAFTPEGRFRPDSLVPYAAATRQVAAELNVPLLDLYAATRAQAEEAGPAGAAKIGLLGKDGKQDNTHLGPYGQATIGRMAATALVRAVPALAVHLLEP